MQLILCNANLLKLLHFKCGYGPSTVATLMRGGHLNQPSYVLKTNTSLINSYYTNASKVQTHLLCFGHILLNLHLGCLNSQNLKADF